MNLVYNGCNLGNDLIKVIYHTAYRLEANTIVVNSFKYNKRADIGLFCDDGCIEWHYIVSV